VRKRSHSRQNPIFQAKNDPGHILWGKRKIWGSGSWGPFWELGSCNGGAARIMKIRKKLLRTAKGEGVRGEGRKKQ